MCIYWSNNFKQFAFSVIVISMSISTAWLIMPDQAMAGYLDPGSGSTVVQGIISGMAFASRIRKRLGSFFSRLLKRSPD